MNWFVNENTCFPPLASIYAFYRVHLATPSLFPTPPLSLSIVSILSIHPLSGHPSAAHPPPSYLSHAFTPRDNPLRPVPLSPPMSAIVSVYRVHIIVMTLRRYGDLRGGGGGGGGAKNRGNLRSKLFASGPMRISAANYNYSRDSRAWKRLFDERIAWWGRGGRWKR